MPTIKEKVRMLNTRQDFEKLIEKYVSPAKEIIAEILGRDSEGIPYKELWNLFCKRIPFKWKIIKIFNWDFGFGYDEMRIFLIALEDLKKERRIKEEKGIYYP